MIVRSPYPDVALLETALTPFILRRASALANKPALIDGLSGRAITYRDLAGGIARVAAGLARGGFEKGDVLAIFSPNVPEYAVAFHAVATLGGITTTINPLYTTDEMAHQLADSGARYLLTVPELMDKASEAARRHSLEEIFVFGEASGARPFSSLLDDAAAPAEVAEATIDPRRDLVALPYSSGTTGLPKGVMLTHFNLVANLCQIEAIRLMNQEDTLVCVLPMFHIYGLVVIMNSALAHGATIVTMPRFDLEDLLGVMQRHAVTIAPLVPPIVLALAKHPIVGRFDLSALRTIFCAAAPLGEPVSRACSERLGCIVRQGYGMTEASPATHMSPWRRGRIRHGSVGLLVPNTECKMIDPENGAELGANQAGEICIRGPQVMKGYLNKPDATARAIDSEGWLHTGDIGYADEDGYFTIVDRAKELIKYKGFQVAPAELEAVLLSHSSVADAAVIPVPDEEAGEIPKAFVVLKSPVEAGESAAAMAEEILAYVALRVAPFKKIRRLEFTDKIPKLASGKILRRVLIEKEREGRASSASEKS